MLPEDSKNCMFLPTAKDIWEIVKQTYSKKHDTTMLFELKTRISATKQGPLFIVEYFQSVKWTMLEVHYYQELKVKCIEDAQNV